MPFIIEFDIPAKAYAEFQDKVIWNQLKDTPAKELKRYLFKFVRSKGYSVTFRDLSNIDPKPLVLGLNTQSDHKIDISSTELTLSELPAVIIHECFHSIFAQLENEDYIELLEKRVIKALTIKEANRLLREVFKRGNFVGPIATVGVSPKSKSEARRASSKKSKRSTNTKKRILRP